MIEKPSQEDLHKFILRFVQDVDRERQINIAYENEQDFKILHGLVQRSRRFANAFLRLHHDGFGPEGMVLIRSALEHVVTAQWSYLIVGGMDRLRISITRKEADYAKSAAEFYGDSRPEWAEHEAALRSNIPAGKALPKFSGPEGMLAELDTVKFLSIVYNEFSQVEHVTHRTIFDYMVADEDGIALLDQPVFEFEHAAFYMLAGISILGSWLIARLEDNKSEILKLQGEGVRLQLPWRLDTNLPRERRRFPDEPN